MQAVVVQVKVTQVHMVQVVQAAVQLVQEMQLELLEQLI